MWRLVRPGEGARLRQWLEGFGPATVNHQDLLDGPPWGPDRHTPPAKFWVWDQGSLWLGCLGLRSRSVWLPAFLPELPEEALAEARRTLLRRLGSIYTLLGTLAQTSRLEPFLPFQRPLRRVAYDFMVRSADLTAPSPSLPAGVEVVRLTPALGEAVFPLQEAYEKEEVLFHPSDFQPLASRMHFRQSLHRSLVLGLRKENRWICKGGTNARGRYWAQIGGVYTVPEERRKGWQTLLMKALSAELASQGAGCCLFVKKENPGARELYLKLGYRIVEDFEISYWEN